MRFFRILIALRQRFLPTNELDSIMGSLEDLVVNKALLEGETIDGLISFLDRYLK